VSYGPGRLAWAPTKEQMKATHGQAWPKNMGFDPLYMYIV